LEANIIILTRVRLNENNVVVPDERYYADQMRILWNLHHERDLPETDFNWQSWQQQQGQQGGKPRQ